MLKAFSILLTLFLLPFFSSAQANQIQHQGTQLNSDGSVTVIKPHVVFNGQKTLFNARGLITADEHTPGARAIHFDASGDTLYFSTHGEMICALLLGRIFVAQAELTDRHGFVTSAPIVSLDKHGNISAFSDAGYAINTLTCR